MGDSLISMEASVGADHGEATVAHLGTTATRRLRTHAAAHGLPADELARVWLLQRLEVEEAARRARGGGVEQLLRLVQAIDEVDLPA